LHVSYELSHSAACFLWCVFAYRVLGIFVQNLLLSPD
jgi:hypothetical protein